MGQVSVVLESLDGVLPEALRKMQSFKTQPPDAGPSAPQRKLEQLVQSRFFCRKAQAAQLGDVFQRNRHEDEKGMLNMPVEGEFQNFKIPGKRKRIGEETEIGTALLAGDDQLEGMGNRCERSLYELQFSTVGRKQGRGESKTRVPVHFTGTEQSMRRSDPLQLRKGLGET